MASTVDACRRVLETMSSINQKTIPGTDLRTMHDNDEPHEPRNTADESALGEGRKRKDENASPAEAEHPPKELTTEQLNRNFLEAIVDSWNEREQAAFIQDMSPLMSDYVNLAAKNREQRK